jgi:hypothetical protein
MPWTTAVTRSSGFSVTAAVWNSEHVDNMNFLKEVGYTQFTSAVSVTATTDATADTVVSSGAITYEAVPHLIEFFVRAARPDSGAAGRNLNIALYDSTTSLGLIGLVQTPAAATMWVPVYAMRRLTPTAASHTYIVKAWVNAGTGNIDAGAGGAGVGMPGFIRITRVPT